MSFILPNHFLDSRQGAATDKKTTEIQDISTAITGIIVVSFGLEKRIKLFSEVNLKQL